MSRIPQDSMVADDAPVSDQMTAYDKSHMLVYVRLLDAAAEGAAWDEVCSVLFGVDAAKEPLRARRMYNSHMKRAEWFSAQGYRDLLQNA